MIYSVGFLFPVTVVVTIGLYHATSVQSVAISGIESTFVNKRSTGNGKVEDVKRMLVVAMLRKLHDQKSVRVG